METRFLGEDPCRVSSARSRPIWLPIALMLCLVMLAGCQKATRFAALPKAKAAPERGEAKAIWGWALPEKTPHDLPIRFVASDRPEWQSLPGFWNVVPHPVAGTRTLHLGQSPLAIVATFVVVDPFEAITIKVPRGLPDPTPLIPECNPPTFGKWRLGKKIFFEQVLAAGSTNLSCATCHEPRHGFTEPEAVSREGTRNTLSLLNVAFNRSQFWDGRVRDLEETLVQTLDDELEAGSNRLKVLKSHRFGGVAQRLDKNEDYQQQFRQVFGVGRVTQDAVAKALATYIRTIMSGDSIFDRAMAEGRKSKAEKPTAEHFKAVLTDDAMKRLAPPGAIATRDEVAEKLVLGQSIYHGKGACVQCHPTGIFTDQQFHNVLIGDSTMSQVVSGKETGRFAALPIGLKDPKMRGAYRTPTLRNLSATPPYFHNGFRSELDAAVDHFRQSLDLDAPLLAAPLRKALTKIPQDSDSLSFVLFNFDERDALVLFLRSLDGQPVDPVVSNK